MRCKRARFAVSLWASLPNHGSDFERPCERSKQQEAFQSTKDEPHAPFLLFSRTSHSPCVLPERSNRNENESAYVFSCHVHPAGIGDATLRQGRGGARLLHG